MVGACVTRNILILWNNTKGLRQRTLEVQMLLWCRMSFQLLSLDLIIDDFWRLIGKATGSSSKAKVAPPSVSLSNPNLLHSLSLQMCCGVSGGPVGMWWNVDGREGRAFFNARICHNTGVLSSYAVRRFENVHPFLLPKVWCGRNQGLGHHKMSQRIMMIWRCYKEADIEMRQRCLELCWEAQAGELVILTDLAPSHI